MTNAHLQTSGPNGGRYGPLGSFPPNSTNGNFFRDIVFVPGSAPPDPTPPTVAITQPGAGTTVTGTVVTLAATASDNVGVAGVQFQIDGSNVGAEQTTSWVLEQLYTVVNTRYEDRRSVILTTNLIKQDRRKPANVPDDEWDARPDAADRGPGTESETESACAAAGP